MVTLKHCAEMAGLTIDELILGVTPSRRHHVLLKSYQLNSDHGRAKVLEMMVCDLRGYVDIGAHRVAADLLVVLRLFLSEQRELAAAPRRQPNDHAIIAFDRALARQGRVPAPAWRERVVNKEAVVELC
ncbi:MAG: polysaccharide deacetylase [Methylocystis sp.]